MADAIKVTGVEKSVAVIERAGEKATDQTGSLEQASRVEAVSQGAWENISGALTAGLNEHEVNEDSLRILSTTEYASYVFYGTVRQDARPPKIEPERLTQTAMRLVANDLLGQ